MKEGQFILDIMKFFTMNVARHWNRLPGEVGNSSALKTFKVKLDGAETHLKRSLSMAGELN